MTSNIGSGDVHEVSFGPMGDVRPPSATTPQSSSWYVDTAVSSAGSAGGKTGGAISL